MAVTYFNNLETPPNKELFYDYQISRKRLTWSLKNSGGIVLKGFLDEGDLAFRVGHSYSGSKDETELLSKGVDLLNKGSDYIRFGTNVAQQFGSEGHTLSDIENYITGGNSIGIGEAIQEGVDTVSDWIDKLSKLALGEDTTDKLKGAINEYKRGRWFSALDFIKTFQGTNIEFQIPELRTFILSGIKGIKVFDTITELNDKFIGDVKPFGGMFGLQDSPNKYLPTFQGLDTTTKFQGIFTLELGERVELTNLILTDYTVNISKFHRMKPDGSVDTDPLYAEVTVSLEPASYITKEKLKSYLKK